MAEEKPDELSIEKELRVGILTSLQEGCKTMGVAASALSLGFVSAYYNLSPQSNLWLWLKVVLLVSPIACLWWSAYTFARGYLPYRRVDNKVEHIPDEVSTARGGNEFLQQRIAYCQGHIVQASLAFNAGVLLIIVCVLVLVFGGSKTVKI